MDELFESIFRPIIYVPDACFNLRYVVAFQKQSASLAIALENQTLDFLTPVKIREE